jgi:hypothetical protein
MRFDSRTARLDAAPFNPDMPSRAIAMMSKNRIYALVRVLTWASFLLCPVAFSLALMDYAAHNGGPGIGLEGAGRPGSSTTPLLMIAFVGIVGGFSARMMLPDAPDPRRVSLPRVVGVCVLCFIGSMVGARPLFHWKWNVDCNNGVGIACWTLARMAPPADQSALVLGRKACSLGEPDACKHLTEGAPEDKASACAERKTACEKATWPEAACKELDDACGSL